MKDIVFLKVFLWGEEIGRIGNGSGNRPAMFEFCPQYLQRKENITDLSFSLEGRNPLFPVYSEEDPVKYKGLPAFLADSLPDHWGSTLFSLWLKEQKISTKDVSPLLKLAYIGRRGMGALEFVPEIDSGSWRGGVDIASLASLARKVAIDRETVEITSEEQLTMKVLRQLGSAPGGRMEKILIDIDEPTGKIISGQTGSLQDCSHYLLKFGDEEYTSAEIEQTFYQLATDAGIEMNECRLMNIDGINHFLTKRFDRDNGEKIHTQTMAAMATDIRSYEGAVSLLRKMRLPESSCQELYKRMVFNMLSNNTDDHDRNFSFLRHRNGNWKLAPAYDLTYIIDPKGHIPNQNHVISMGGKYMDFTRNDMIRFAETNDIRSANNIIHKVADSLLKFRDTATKNGVRPFWVGRIDDAIHEHLERIGEWQRKVFFPFKDKNGHETKDLSIVLERNGAYRITATVDGNERKYFIQRNTAENIALSHKGITNLSPEDTRILLENTLLRKTGEDNRTSTAKQNLMDKDRLINIASRMTVFQIPAEALTPEEKEAVKRHFDSFYSIGEKEQELNEIWKAAEKLPQTRTAARWLADAKDCFCQMAGLQKENDLKHGLKL